MKTHLCDVLVVGAGAAGVFGALSAARAGARVCLASKSSVLFGNTRLAGGLVACPGLLEADSGELFIRDVLAGGEEMNDRRLIEVVARRGKEVLCQMERWGFLFARDAAGELRVAKPGGHSVPRALYCAYRGLSLSSLLRLLLARQEELALLEGHLLFRLVKDEGRVCGAVFLNLYSGEPVLVRAGAVLLATGGAGMLYAPHTDNSCEATGDGLAAALRAGAELVDMEFIQCIPFSVTMPEELAGIDCGEPSHAGPCGVLQNNRGEIFLSDMSSMTRAQVNRAIFTQLKTGGGTERGGVLFHPRDNRAHPAGEKLYQQTRAAGILDVVRRAYGEDAYLWRAPYEVAPSAHYTLGGVRVDEHGFTGVEGLFAAGEVTGGFHGADRLGSTALTECFVFGETAGRFAWEAAQHLGPCAAQAAQDGKQLRGLFGRKGSQSPVQLQKELGASMWENAGGVRDRAGLRSALARMEDIALRSQRIQTPAVAAWNQPVKAAIELENLLLVGQVVIGSALAREESRGGHFRWDFPDARAEWENRTVVAVQGEGGAPLVRVQSKACAPGNRQEGRGAT